MNDEEMNERNVFASKRSSISYLIMAHYQIVVHLGADDVYRIIFAEHVHIDPRPVHDRCQLQLPPITQPQLHLNKYLL